MLPLILLFALAPTLGAPAGPGLDVVRVANRYQDGGGYHWRPGNSGTPVAIRFGGEEILPRGEGSFCCGFTLAVVIEVARERGLLNGKTPAQLKAFQRDWYGDGPDSRETLVVHAMERLEIGQAVKLQDARPGDFVQLWRRSGSGHSVVLLGLVREGGEVIGMNYRSSQKSTDGIGNRTEYFADATGHDGAVLRDRTHVGRLHPAADEQPK